MDAKAIAKSVEQYTVDLRHEFHMHPELPLEEIWTAGRIREELEKMNIPYAIVGDHNVIGWLDSGKGGKTIALRADIDALPVDELVDVPYKSQIPGKMHACGHDAHAAMLLGTAKALVENPELLTGKVYFVFQCAEEIGKCADECVAWLVQQGDVDNALAMHLGGEFPVGTMNLLPGARFSGAEIFYIDIHGKGGHGSRPDLVIDPIRVACEIYTKISSIPSNRHSMFDTCVVSPCMVSGGNRFNVFPDTAHIEGTVRYYKPGDGQRVFEKIRAFAEATAAMYGATATVTFGVGAKCPVINDPAITAVGRQVWEEMGLNLVPACDPSAGSDNFAEFLEVFPGFYAVLGSYTELPNTSGNHHNATFYVDDACLPLGVAFFLGCLEKLQ